MTLHLCDSNVWLALTISGHPQHAVARAWLESVEEAASILFCRSTQQSFLRLLTTAAVLAPTGDSAFTNEEAWATYERFLSDYRVIFREEPVDLEPRWQEYARRATASPKLWMDAYLAAFARTEGSQIVTLDSAFRQFRGLDLLLLGEGTQA